jgi:hypothetical protein
MGWHDTCGTRSTGGHPRPPRDRKCPASWRGQLNIAVVTEGSSVLKCRYRATAAGDLARARDLSPGLHLPYAWWGVFHGPQDQGAQGGQQPPPGRTPRPAGGFSNKRAAIEMAGTIQKGSTGLALALVCLLVAGCSPAHAALQEAAPLLAFKLSVSAGSADTLADWEPGADPCGGAAPWTGVSCTAGRVTSMCVPARSQPPASWPHGSVVSFATLMWLLVAMPGGCGEQCGPPVVEVSACPAAEMHGAAPLLPARLQRAVGLGPDRLAARCPEPVPAGCARPGLKPTGGQPAAQPGDSLAGGALCLGSSGTTVG